MANLRHIAIWAASPLPYSTIYKRDSSNQNVGSRLCFSMHGVLHLRLNLIYSGFPLHTLDVSYIILIYVHQGPALYAYNNAEFTKEDWKGIRMLCDSIKVKDPMKVGRFGLGFKSVFHITGEITIIYLPDLD